MLRRNIDDVFAARDALGTDALAGGLGAATRRWNGKSGGIANFDLESARAPTNAHSLEGSKYVRKFGNTDALEITYRTGNVGSHGFRNTFFRELREL